MKMKKQLPFYQIEGNYREVGEFMGSTFRDRIQGEIFRRRKEIEDYFGYLPKVQKCLEITRRCLPNLMIESEAIARAAEVPLVEFFFLNNRESYDEDEIRIKKDAIGGDHCTVVGGFDGGKLIMGHNEDWTLEALDHFYILKATIGGVTFIGLNYTDGVAGLSASMNSFGLVQCVNDIYQTNRVGVPKNYVARAVLEAKTLDEAEKIIRNLPRASGFNHVLAQGKEIRNIEIAGDSVGIQSVVGKPYVHTNHYLSEEMKSLERFHTRSSEARYKRALEMLRDSMSVEDVVKILSDTQDDKYPICNPNKTIGSAIFVPDELTANFCYGHPCAGEYVKYMI